MLYSGKDKKQYIVSGDILEAFVIDEDLREFLSERGFVNPKIGDYYINGAHYRFSIMEKEKFERTFVEVEVKK